MRAEGGQRPGRRVVGLSPELSSPPALSKKSVPIHETVCPMGAHEAHSLAQWQS